MSGKVRVSICLPNEGWHHKFLMTWVGKIISNPEYEKKYHFDFMLREQKPIDNNRNHMVQDFLNTKNEYLIFIDSDNPPYKDPIPLIELDKDIMACPTPVWNAKRFFEGGFPMFYNCMVRIDERDGWHETFPQEGLQEIDAAGTGCMIIARRVLEKVRPAFVRRWKDNGTVSHGSDFEFCRRAKEAGFTVWCHFDYPCHHFKEVDLLEAMQIFKVRDISNLPRKNCNTKEYWDSQWEKREERLIEPYRIILGLLSETDCVLDFGCGRGDLLAQLHRKCSYAAGVDISEKAVEVCESRGLTAEVGTKPRLLANGQKWDAIVCTEVLEHLDDDIGMIEEFFRHTDRVIFSVPNNCLPPGLEPEHRRVYTYENVFNDIPNFKHIHVCETYMVVIAEKEKANGGLKQLVSRGDRRDRQGDDQPECLDAESSGTKLDRSIDRDGVTV